MVVIMSIIGSVLVGGAVATATIVGVVNSQTAAPASSPTSVVAPLDQQIQYGDN